MKIVIYLQPKYSLIFLMLASILILTSSSTVSAQTEKTLFPSKDNTLYEHASGALSNGAGIHIFAGKVGPTGGDAIRRSLIAFAISDSIPAGSTIDSVKLTLNMSRTISGDRNVELRKVLTDWGEGTSDANLQEGIGASSTSGDATWIHTFFNTANWTNPGGDFSAIVSASQTVGSENLYTWRSSELTADVQGWLDDSLNNFGWIVLGDESQNRSAKRFDSRENPTVENRPQLTVYYKEASTSVFDEFEIPTDFTLYQNYPNPFNPSTIIEYLVAKDSRVSLKIYDLMGKEIRVLVEGYRNAGLHQVTWDGTNNFGNVISSGIYVYRLQAGDFSKSAKLMFIQ